MYCTRGMYDTYRFRTYRQSLVKSIMEKVFRGIKYHRWKSSRCKKERELLRSLGSNSLLVKTLVTSKYFNFRSRRIRLLR